MQMEKYEGGREEDEDGAAIRTDCVLGSLCCLGKSATSVKKNSKTPEIETSIDLFLTLCKRLQHSHSWVSRNCGE